MANCLNFWFACIAMIGISMFAIGCNPSELSDVELPIPVESASIGKQGPQTQVVKVASAADSVSPAIKASELPPPESSPQDVCQRFLDNLNRENVDYFELLLTPAALNMISRHHFHLPPVASREAIIELSEPKYNNNMEKLCYIDCKIIEPEDAIASGESMTWMLRKTASGWRVAGMLIEENDTGILDLLSFENDSDIAQIKSSLTRDVGTTVISR